MEGNVWVEVSNDPNVLVDNSSTQIAAPGTPVLSQYTPTPDQHLSGVAVNTTYYVKNTYTTSPGVYSTLPNGGESLPSTEASLTVLAGNLLVVKAPAPDAGGFAAGWNCYISTTTGTETRQNTGNALSFSTNFTPTTVVSSQIAVPSSNTTGTPNSGVNITGNLVGATASGITALGLNQIQIVVSGSSAMINPSGIIWNYIRVNKSGGGASLTQAFLFGQSA
jgi:hypothetical protein